MVAVTLGGDTSTDAFEILIAEVLLKQTNADNVATVWPKLVDRYGDPTRLSTVDPTELFLEISKLGFGQQRSKALIDLAKAIVTIGDVPSDVQGLLELPFVGIYTAHAVSCFAFGQHVPVVDLSIVRLVSRLRGLDPPKDIRRAQVIWDIAWELLPNRHVKEHNYGLLDFAAKVCSSKAPKCGECQYCRNVHIRDRERQNNCQNQVTLR